VHILEKSIANHNKRHETHFKKLEIENQNLLAHIVQLKRKVEMGTENLKRKKPKLTDENTTTSIFPPLPTDIDA